jgi:hypothetical protein
MAYVSLGILERSHGKVQEAETLMKSGRWDQHMLPKERVGRGDSDARGAQFGLAGTVYHTTHRRDLGWGLSPVAVYLPRADPLRQHATWLIETIAEPPQDSDELGTCYRSRVGTEDRAKIGHRSENLRGIARIQIAFP